MEVSYSMRPPPAPAPASSGPSVILALVVSFGFLAIAAWIVFSQLHR